MLLLILMAAGSPNPVLHETQWARLGVGSVIETEVVAVMEVPPEWESPKGSSNGMMIMFGSLHSGTSKERFIHTLIRRNSKEVVLRLESEREGKRTVIHAEQKVPLLLEELDPAIQRKLTMTTIGPETIKTPAGEFHTTHTRVESTGEDAAIVADTWSSVECPVAIKEVEVSALFGGKVKSHKTTTLVRFSRAEPHTPAQVP
ncbi:MAG TPA: hypothetical protein VH083_16475 [Myxococcales bacterium]|jgi:hypothetical protein|nr:hypothetical protein [Myxococcales bacterium]